ncbi:MAG: hypothetical protein F6K18_13355 [Okeania sp. SIO2C2]|uniref:hypothetical protein n=1 Tax=unclassified Okeania TaxID=2634635 RepID=UPI0013BC2A02|nr:MULTISPECIES: hypothetical protein [unclassified Okeania]NEP87722.1 hypothetical protein [Okeania sp. SIO2C2]
MLFPLFPVPSFIEPLSVSLNFLFFVSQAIANHPKVVSPLKIRQEGKTIDLTYHLSN